MGNRKSLLSRIDTGTQSTGKTVYPKKQLDAARMYEDANKYLGYVFKMCADFFDYHPRWLFPGGGHGGRRKGRKKGNFERSIASSVG